ELVPEHFGRKKAIVDIRGIDENERQLSIELQRESQPEFIPRCLFYWGKNYVQQLGAGRTYKDLKATVLISLLCFSLYTEKDNEKSVWDFILTNPQTGRILTEDELLIFVELEKFTQAMRKLHKEKKGIDHASLTEKERLLLWGSYINNVEEGVDLMDNLAREDSVFKEVQSAEKTYWSAPENRYLQLQEEIADLDYRTGLLDAEQRGEMRNKLQTAREMKAEGLPIELIARITKLSEEKIRLM
ncbi:MAG: Rpn family recombination-promoting nuclease/putative transposase, partial [Synergistaceae bacterium]|nr:Rpn family recombination-promoting nuclease/putative transposase [Synergistaceae bacterium]